MELDFTSPSGNGSESPAMCAAAANTRSVGLRILLEQLTHWFAFARGDPAIAGGAGLGQRNLELFVRRYLDLLAVAAFAVLHT